MYPFFPVYARESLIISDHGYWIMFQPIIALSLDGVRQSLSNFFMNDYAFLGLIIVLGGFLFELLIERFAFAHVPLFSDGGRVSRAGKAVAWIITVLFIISWLMLGNWLKAVESIRGLFERSSITLPIILGALLTAVLIRLTKRAWISLIITGIIMFVAGQWLIEESPFAVVGIIAFVCGAALLINHWRH
jgi:uncharacterized membrane protein YhdT